MTLSTERKYNARITQAYVTVDSPESTIFYDAETVNTQDKVKLTRVKPFRRWVFGEGPEEPTIRPAKVGDDCDIAVCQGEARLTNVPEQYLVGPCDEEPPAFGA